MLAQHKELVVDAVVERLRLLFTAELPDGPMDRVNRGFVDFVLPFEKFEGHPSRKARDGRWRIVTGLSLVDQLVERVLYSDFVETVKEAYPRAGVVIGIGFTDEMAYEFCESLNRRNLWSTDVSGMDRSLHASYLRECVERRLRVLPISGFDSYRRAVRSHNECLLDPVFAVTTHGHARLYVSYEPGGMLSGRFVTTYFNSDMRIDMAYLAGASGARATGDDCLENHDKTEAEIVKAYDDLGFKLRDPVLITDDVFYCSHRFIKSKSWKPALDSWPKALHKLASRKINYDLIDVFLHEVRHNDNYHELKSLLEEEGAVHLA